MVATFFSFPQLTLAAVTAREVWYQVGYLVLGSAAVFAFVFIGKVIAGVSRESARVTRQMQERLREER